MKAKLQPPKGKSLGLDINKFLQNKDDDNEFFHVTCHINPNLRNKIAKDEFIDLEQLLPKDRNSNGFGLLTAKRSDENRVELVSRDGHTYFRVVKDNQITGLCRREQAFRVYVAMYTEYNLERSGEIWQYVHTINLAASSFHWDNISSYDLTFRQLIAFKLHCSWAKIYNQGWNLAMRDPIRWASTENGSGNGSTSFVQTNSNKRRDWRDDCCWKFNRN